MSALSDSKKLSKEHRRKISEALMGRVLSKESIKKGAETRRGVPLSKTHKEALSKAKKVFFAEGGTPWNKKKIGDLKICPKCLLSASEVDFYKDLSKSDKLSSWCKICIQNKSSKYIKENRELYNQKRSNRKRTDINFKLSCSLRNRLHSALKNNYKSGSAVRDLGCSIPELKEHLESQFKPGMTWENWSRTGWHIDHIRPLSRFDLTDRNQLLKVCHFGNLQPLWAEENFSKSNKVDI